MTTLRTAGIHHVTMVARSAPRTIAFYHDVLGLALVKRTVNFDDPSSAHLYFGDAQGAPGTLVTFFEAPALPQGRYGVGGVHHLAFGTESRVTLLMWKRYLTDRGVPVTGPMERGYFQSLYFRDPDGQVLEIATRGPGYAHDEPADALGRRLIVPPPAQLPATRDKRAIVSATHPEPVPAITDAMRLQGIHHVTGMTDDLERANDFLEQALGLTLVKQSVNQDDPSTLHHFWARYDGATVAPHSSYTLFGWPGANALRARPGVGQTHHVAFRAPDGDSQLAWRDRLLSLGIGVSPVMDRSYFTSIYFQAPDGMLFEIATDGPGFAVDEPIDALGTEVKRPAWLEAARKEVAGATAPAE
jgi:glyoxalase family protein